MRVIDVKNLSFSYTRNIPVLKSISFNIESGEYVCLLGPNGVGKSTLFQCMLGLNGKYSGEIFVNGENIQNLTEKQLAKKVAYIPQSSVHAFNYTVEDVVLMGTTALTSGFGSPGEREHLLIENALNKLHILHLRDRKYQNISGGERQLVLIARALSQQARILFMDEPTANLDYGNQCRVLEEIRTLTSEGYTVVQSTHNPDQAFLYADKVLAVSDGRIAAYGTPCCVLTEDLMSNLYGVDIAVMAIGSGSAKICVPKNVLGKNLQKMM